jgi:hypothetical protein
VRRAAALFLTCLSLVAACSSATPGDAPSVDAGADGGTRALDASTPDGAREDGPTSVDAISPGTDAESDSAANQTTDGGSNDADAGNGCFVSTVGVTGECMTTTACAALGNHTSTAGYCPGPADIECCTVTPNVADDPPVPAGWVLMAQSAVTSQMTTWAVAILDDPTTYPMFSTTIQVFGATTVMARVEWHPPDFQNSTVHRGVTLYVPSDGG